MQVVYYPSIVPNNRYTITQLAILFDEILLPGAYLPFHKLDPKDIKDVIANIERADKQQGVQTTELLLPLYFALEFGELSEIFTGTGEWGHMGTLEPEASKITLEIESLYFGPPPVGVTPLPNMGFNIGVGSGNDVTNQINGPATFSYPANAYVYAQKNNLPLISDNTWMPIPAKVPHNANADMLAAQLCVASLDLILPRIKPLGALEILEVRDKMKNDIRALNATLLGYAGKLRGMVGEEPSLELLQNEAEFIAKTEIYPQIEHLRRTLETPGRILKRNMLDLVIENPELITRIALNPHDIQAWLDVLKVSGKSLSKTIGDIRLKAEKERASGLSLLIKLPNKYAK